MRSLGWRRNRGRDPLDPDCNLATNAVFGWASPMASHAPKTMRSIEDKIVTLEDLPAAVDLGRIGLCTGCYDILQSGHAVFFEQCRQHCDTLCVVIGRGSVIAQQKPGRPFNPDNNRLFLVAAMEAVDYTLLGDDRLLPGKIDCFSFCERMRPHVYILNEDDSGLPEKRVFCATHNIELKLVARTVPQHLEATSTTELADKLMKTP